LEGFFRGIINNLFKNINLKFRFVFPGQADRERDNNLPYQWKGGKVIVGKIITLLPSL
jgi:hypothetical protein